MSSPTFLRIDQQSISVAQVLQYLQRAGKFSSFVLDILHQHALEQALQAHPTLSLSPETFGQAFLDFRMQHDLLDPDRFQTWLSDRGSTPEAFLEQFRREQMINQLIAHISQPKLQDYFEQHQFLLERVMLAAIVVDTAEIADILAQRLAAGDDFDQLEHYHSEIDGEIERHQLEIKRGHLPDDLRAEIDAASIGSVVGPVELEDGWWLFRIDGWQPAQLDDELKHQWQAEIFDQWLADKVQAMTVELQVNNNDSSTRSTGYSYAEPSLDRSPAEFAHQ